MTETAAKDPETIVAAPGRSLTERVLEGILIVFCAALFTFMLSESLRWSSGVALLPRIAAGFGLIVLVAYAIDRFRPRPAGAAAKIMDLGFDEGDLDRATVLSRTARFVLTTGGLFLGVWIIGFHVAVPIYMVAYLIIYGKMPWWGAALCALGFEAFMIVMYDMIIRQAWPEPLIKLPFIPTRY